MKNYLLRVNFRPLLPPAAGLFAAFLLAAALPTPAAALEFEIPGTLSVTGTSSFYGGVQVSSAAGYSGNLLIVSTGASNVVRMTGDGVIYATGFYGDGSAMTDAKGDNLGNHVATTTLQMGSGQVVFGDAALSRGAANRLDIASGDSLRIQNGALMSAGATLIGANALFRPSAGSAAAASLGFSTMSGLGVYQAAANTVGFAANSQNRMSIGVNGVGLSSAIPGYALSVSSAAGSAADMLVISTGGVSVIRLTGAGEVYANRYYGDGGGLTGGGASDNLGNHLATTTVNMAGFNVINALDVSASYSPLPGWPASTVPVSAAYYQILGSTVLAAPQVSNLLFGINAAPDLQVTATSSTFIGNNTGIGYTNKEGGTFLGNNAGGSGASTAVGYKAGSKNASDTGTFIGALAGENATNAEYSAMVGYAAGKNVTTGVSNTFLGAYAGFGFVTGSSNVAVGNYAGFSRDGDKNVFVGWGAGYGGGGTARVSSNTVVGTRAGYSLTSGAENILLGWQAGYAITSGTGNIIIGYNQDATAPTTNNFLNIGGTIYGNLGAGTKKIGIAATNINATLEVGGSLGAYSRTFAQLQVQTITAVGQVYYCSDCSPKKLVISTGTAPGNFADIDGGTFK